MAYTTRVSKLEHTEHLLRLELPQHCCMFEAYEARIIPLEVAPLLPR